MCSKSKDNIVLNLQVLRIRKIFNMEELLYLLHTIFGKVDILLFLVNNKVSRLFNIFTHDGIHLGKLAACLTTL